MFRLKSAPKTLIDFIRKNIFLSVFVLIICLVGVIATARILKDDSEYIYVKVKVSQGLWWAYTQQPSMWYLKNIKPGLKQVSLSGKVQSEIIEARYYPGTSHNEYDVYVTIKAKAQKNSRTQIYSIDRQDVITASPIEFKFPSTLVTGTVMDVSTKPLNDTYLEKTIVIAKDFAPLWEYDQITIGDTYFDGEDTTVTVIDKQESDTYGLVSSGLTVYPIGLIPQKAVTVTLKVKLKKELNRWILNESQLIQAGKQLNISTDNFRFVEYRIAEVK